MEQLSNQIYFHTHVHANSCVDPMPARREGRAAKGQPSGTNDPGLKASGQKEGPL